MATRPDDGRVWGRPEALDTLGHLPGRGRRWLGTALGVAAIGTGAYLGFTGPASGATSSSAPTTAATTAASTPACASIGITLPNNRIPAEGIKQERDVVRLSQTGADGKAQLLVPEAGVLRVTPVDDGIQVSVLVRADQGGQLIEQINAANADGSLAAAVLYEVDWLDTVNACRGRR